MKMYFLLFFLISAFNLLSQEKDTLKLHKMYLLAHDIEKSFPDSALKIYAKVIEITKANPNQKVVGMSYNRLSDLIHSQKNDVKQRFDFNFKALSIFEAIKDSAAIAQINENIGIAFVEQNRYSEALRYHKTAFGYSSRKKLTTLLISSTMSIADCYSSMGKVDSAIYFMKRLEDNFPLDASKSSLAMFYGNIGNTYYNLAEVTKNRSDYQNAANYALKSKNTCIAYNLDVEDLAYAYGLIGVSYMALNNFDESQKNYLEAIKIYEGKKMNFQLNQMYLELTQLFIKMGEKENALTYFMKFDSISKLIYNEENINSVSAMKTQFETEKKEQENKLLQTENKLSSETIKQQKIITVFIVIGLLIVSILAFFIFKGLKKQRKANAIISEQKLIVEQQKNIVEEKHKEITDSINYAERIQRSFLATTQLLDENLNRNVIKSVLDSTAGKAVTRTDSNYFVFFQPKDVVSGDFYWAAKLCNGHFALATADSTGHGVPGAIMSILNISSLEKAVEQNLCEPAEILNHTRKTIIERLKKDGSAEGGKDGMDASLIRFDFKNSKLTYAAANNPIWIIRTLTSSEGGVSRSELLEFSSDKMPVGKHDNDQIPFTQQTIDLQKGDVVYALTDGFPDQFGGPKGKKFMYKQLKELLISISSLPMQEQQETLKAALNNWKGNLEQVDDVCLIGVRI